VANVFLLSIKQINFDHENQLRKAKAILAVVTVVDVRKTFGKPVNKPIFFGGLRATPV
jgi:hypothetical protein